MDSFFFLDYEKPEKITVNIPLLCITAFQLLLLIHYLDKSRRFNVVTNIRQVTIKMMINEQAGVFLNPLELPYCEGP